MHKEIATMWADALTSGEFKQGKYYLRRGDCYCVNGVLVELFRRNNPDTHDWEPATWNEVGVYFYNKTISCIPGYILRWAGVQTNSPRFLDDKTTVSISGLNDTGTPFREIANIIRAKWETI